MKGNPAVTTEPIFVLVPMFSTDNDQNPNDAISCTNVVAGTTCGSALGSTLISLFGALPEAFKATPNVYTQCPEQGSAPGTCTMHASRLDLGPVLVALGYVQPPVTNIFVPTPNHSHVPGDPRSGAKPERLACSGRQQRAHLSRSDSGCAEGGDGRGSSVEFLLVLQFVRELARQVPPLPHAVMRPVLWGGRPQMKQARRCRRACSLEPLEIGLLCSSGDRVSGRHRSLRFLDSSLDVLVPVEMGNRRRCRGLVEGQRILRTIQLL